METLGRARSTTVGYLAEYIARERPATLDHWIDPETYRTVAQAAEQVGTGYLRPVFEHLDGAIPYDDIRLVVAHLLAAQRDDDDAP